ncbi:MAG: hypothetical protein SW833_12545 [Cyanobacteriota bacterium]|nr:hypothetical protein [Cyanobacteriota bacterium]
MPGFRFPFKPKSSPQKPQNFLTRTHSPSPIQQQTNKTLEELERELSAEPQFVQTHPAKPAPKRKKGGFLGKLLGVTALLGIPAGIVWFANLPYAPIRRPVAEKAPILLLPSYASVEHNYREAIASFEAAEQLLTQSTSSADIELGKEKLAAAKQYFDAIPLDFLEDYPDYDYWWYRWRFDPFTFNQYRARIGQLEAIAFQEGNAQTSLSSVEQGIISAKQVYQQATTPEAKQAAIASWQAAIDRLEEISTRTAAGETARQKLATYEREFEDIMASAAQSDRVTNAVAAAKKFAWQAATASQNPPHPPAKWKQVETLWGEAISELKRVSPDEGSGYVAAQELIAQYTTNLEQVKIRRQAEEASVYALERAQKQIESLLARTPNDSQQVDWTGTAAKLQGIIRELESVENGTTAYPKAQELLRFATTKLKEIKQ